MIKEFTSAMIESGKGTPTKDFAGHRKGAPSSRLRAATPRSSSFRPITRRTVADSSLRDLALLRKNGHRSLCFVGKKEDKFKHCWRRPQLNNRPRIRPLKVFPLALPGTAFPRAGSGSEKHWFEREEKICGSCPGRMFSCSRMDQLSWFSKSIGLR